MARAKRGATDLSGIIAIDKPAAMTSHDVVATMRRITGEGRIGHAGTLDPAATGLLIVCIGPATRLADLIMAGKKTYVARVVFGKATDTDDSEGVVVAVAELPAYVADESFAALTLNGFLGEQQQMPPQYSAIKKNGVKAYQLARRGVMPKLESRTITIYGIELLGLGDNFWDIKVEVSKGSYIRSLARDIGEAVCSKAHLGSLRRTRSGAIGLAQAHTLTELEAAYLHAGSSEEFRQHLCGLFLDPVNDLGIEAVKIPRGLRDA